MKKVTGLKPLPLSFFCFHVYEPMKTKNLWWISEWEYVETKCACHNVTIAENSGTLALVSGRTKFIVYCSFHHTTGIVWNALFLLNDASWSITEVISHGIPYFLFLFHSFIYSFLSPPFRELFRNVTRQAIHGACVDGERSSTSAPDYWYDMTGNVGELLDDGRY